MPVVHPLSFDLLYRVRPVSTRAHLFGVELTVVTPPAGPVTVSMPAWIPGSYMIRDFARNLIGISATDAAGNPLTLHKRDKQTWVCDGCHGHLTLSYQVFALELSVRAAHLDTTHGYFNGPGLLLAVQGLESRPCRIELLPPDDADCRDWRLATSLSPLEVDDAGFGAYWARDYADLVDHPVEMGRFTELDFSVRGVPHRLVLSGQPLVDAERLGADLPRICEQHAALFGELPLDRYLFLVTATPDGYGGLEHADSTSLLCARDDLPLPTLDPPEGYTRFLGLCSHEYFHLWHVKRIRPAAFIRGGLDREVHTRLLWAFEGITSYYDDLALVRGGRIDTRAYLGLLATTITRVMRTPGRLVQTLAEASFDAWTKFYKPDENAPNALVSYYAKGALVALALDLTLRKGTAGAVSLDDLMRELWRRHGRTGVGVAERGVEELAATVSGLDLSGFFAQALDSTDDIDFALLLASVGIGMTLRPSQGPKDLGGCVERSEPRAPTPTLDLRLRPGSEAVIQHVISGGAGEDAGLAPGDTIVAVDGFRVTAETLERAVVRAAAQTGHITLHLFRRDQLMTLTAEPRPARADTCDLVILDQVPEPVLQARAAWLASLV